MKICKLFLCVIGLAACAGGQAKTSASPSVLRDSACISSSMSPALRDKIVADGQSLKGAGKADEIVSEMDALATKCAGRTAWTKTRKDQALMYTEFRTLAPAAKGRLSTAGIDPKLIEAAFAKLSLTERLASGTGPNAEAEGEATMSRLIDDLKRSGITKEQIFANNQAFIQFYLWLVMEGRAKRGMTIN
jgi:hypothetical protein